MSKRFSLVVLGLCLCSLGLVGCSEKSSVKTETTTTTPTGTKTVTHESEIKETGDVNAKKAP